MKTIAFYLYFIWHLGCYPYVYGEEAIKATRRFMAKINKNGSHL